MNSNAFQPIYIDVYYWLYLGASAILIAALGRTFHRAGGVFLRDAFAENAKLVDAVARLLDIGFYLVSVGFIALIFRRRSAKRTS